MGDKFSPLTDADLPEKCYTLVWNDAITRTDLSTEARMVYILMLKMKHKDKATGLYMSWPSRAHIAGVLRCRTKDGLKAVSKRTVTEIIRELAEVGLICSVQKDRGRVPKYIIGRYNPSATALHPPSARALPEQDLGRTREAAQNESPPMLVFADTPSKANGKQRGPSEEFLRFVSWYETMHENFPNVVNAPTGAGRLEGLYWHTKRTCSEDAPFDDYDRLTRAVANCSEQGTKVATLPGLLNKSSPSILKLLAYADNGETKVDWGSDE